MLSRFRQWLYESRVRGVDVDDASLLQIHSAILRDKPLLRSAFEAFYRDMADLCDRYLLVEGDEIELGTGAGFFKSRRPQLITSDVRKGPHIDIELDAQAMALPSDSARCIYAINVFHHLSQPERFFDELLRVLRPGGGCILIEPHSGFASTLLHRHLHTDEHFDPDAPGWDTPEIGGPLSGANQALAHIVFDRDRQQFLEKYGDQLELVHCGYELNALQYLFSGGLNFRQLLPAFMATPLRLIERLLRPLARHWSLHQVILLRKRPCSANT
jgi:SAM-dependent methyltransferase